MSLKSELESLEHLAESSYQDNIYLLSEIKELSDKEPNLDVSYMLDLAKSVQNKLDEIQKRIKF